MKPRALRPQAAIIPALTTLLVALTGLLLVPATGSAATNLVTNGTSETSLPKHVLTGYWQNFNNGATVQRISDVQAAYDLIAVAFADADPSRTNSALTVLREYGFDGQVYSQGTVDFMPSTTWPSLRGAMTWSTNWDALNGSAFANQVGAHVHSLP
jgi:chitinase